ncbi:MAG TPA: thioredoxin family protein, partial [Planctomycetota bacterium]|nr:thioredoxin family protein [Planctomycetota bacterium]
GPERDEAAPSAAEAAPGNENGVGEGEGTEATSSDATADAEARPAETDGDAAKDAGPIAWFDDLDKALAEATKLGRPVLVDFGAEWCGWCKKLDRETFGDVRVIRLVREHFVPVRIDTDKSPAIAQRFEVRGLPTLLFLASSGKEMQRFEGFMEAQLFIERAGKAVASSKTLQDLRKAAEASPDDIDAQRAYARALFALGNAAEARGVVDAALARKPGHSGLLLDQADILRELGRHTEARESFEKILAASTDLPADELAAIYLSYGRLLIAMREYRPAVDAFSQYLERRPPKDGQDNSEIWEAHFWRAYSYAVLKDAAKALRDLEVVRDKDPGAWGLRANYIIDIVSPAS